MKKFDLVKLQNDKDYKLYNLSSSMYGVVIETNNKTAQVLFFNNENFGEYAIIPINTKDLIVQKEKLPDQIKEEIIANAEKVIKNAKQKIEHIKIHENDCVQLVVEQEKYAKHKAHKGDTGVVVSSHAVKNEVLVDFSWVDEKGNYYGDCVSVKIDDLKVIKQ